jgi:hypothetical protein
VRVTKVTRERLHFLETEKTIADNEAFRARVSSIALAAMVGYEHGYIARVIPDPIAYKANPRYAESVRNAIAVLQYELQLLATDKDEWYKSHL